MERKQYNELIERLNEYAQKKPRKYKYKVMLLGILGYAYIFFVLGVLLASIAGCIFLFMNVGGVHAVSVKIVIFLGVLAWIVGKSLWIKLNPPDGIEVTREDAPVLFDVIDDICQKQNSPRPHKVLLNDDFNACISQVPRLGIFGWHQNYLVAGLPYMMSCDAEQFKAVLAHELGHFAGAHGRISAWIYRVRLSWMNIVDNFYENRAGGFIFNWFFNLYVPYFNAYSFVLAREQEYEADHFASEYVSAKVNAQELVNAVIKSTVYSDALEAMYQKTRTQNEPVNNACSGLLPLLKQSVPEDDCQKSVRHAVNTRTQNLDTHPALQDRLRPMGYIVKDNQIVSESGEALHLQKEIYETATEYFIGADKLTEYLPDYDRKWADDNREAWTDAYSRFQNMEKELKELEEKRTHMSLSDEDLEYRVYLIDQLSEPDEAVRSMEEFVSENPEHAASNYRLGELMLEKDDAHGAAYLKKAARLNEATASSAYQCISEYYERKGRYQDAESMLECRDSALQKDELDSKERDAVEFKDKFRLHDLSEEEVRNLVSLLEPLADKIKSVYLIEKVLSVYPECPLYVFIVKSEIRWFVRFFSKSSFNDKLFDSVTDIIEPHFLKGTKYYAVGSKPLIKAAEKIPGSLIYKP